MEQSSLIFFLPSRRIHRKGPTPLCFWFCPPLTSSWVCKPWEQLRNRVQLLHSPFPFSGRPSICFHAHWNKGDLSALSTSCPLNPQLNRSQLSRVGASPVCHSLLHASTYLLRVLPAGTQHVPHALMWRLRNPINIAARFAALWTESGPTTYSSIREYCSTSSPQIREQPSVKRDCKRSRVPPPGQCNLGCSYQHGYRQTQPHMSMRSFLNELLLIWWEWPVRQDKSASITCPVLWEHLCWSAGRWPIRTPENWKIPELCLLGDACNEPRRCTISPVLAASPAVAIWRRVWRREGMISAAVQRASWLILKLKLKKSLNHVISLFLSMMQRLAVPFMQAGGGDRSTRLLWLVSMCSFLSEAGSIPSCWGRGWTY